MILRNALLLLSLVASVLVPVAALIAAREPIGMPFGWIRVAAVHLLALLPLGIVSALFVVQLRPTVRPLLAVPAFAVAITITWVTVAHGSSLELDERAPSYIGRLLLRVLWCFALQFPWCMVAVSLAQVGTPRHPWLATILSFIVATVFPAIYAYSLVATQAALAEEELQGGRLARAQPIVARLCEVGSATPIRKLPPVRLRQEIDSELRALSIAAAKPLPGNASPAQRRERARGLAVLDRLEEADRLLEPLAPTDPEAMLLRAAVQQGDQRWDESSHSYRTALTMLDETGARDATGIAARVKAYDNLASNAYKRKAFRDAEAAYLEGLAAVPEAEAHFHYQLGRHHQLGGRPAAALEHLEIATRLAPTPYGELSAPLITKIQLSTPGCLFRPGR